MKKILLDRSPTGVDHIVHVSDDELITIEHTPTAVEKIILDANAHSRNHERPNTKANFRHAARVPINTYMGWKKEWASKYKDTYTWGQFEIMKLNSPEFKYLRTMVNKL